MRHPFDLIYAESLFRPFARLRLMTRLPAAVAILCKKPCFLDRLILLG